MEIWECSWYNGRRKFADLEQVSVKIIRRKGMEYLNANAGKVERAIEEAASRCAEESEYIAEPEKMEMVEEPMSIRLRRAR